MSKTNMIISCDMALEYLESRLGSFIRSTYFHYLSESVDYYEHGKIVNGKVVMYSESTYRIY